MSDEAEHRKQIIDLFKQRLGLAVSRLQDVLERTFTAPAHFDGSFAIGSVTLDLVVTRNDGRTDGTEDQETYAIRIPVHCRPGINRIGLADPAAPLTPILMLCKGNHFCGGTSRKG